MQSISIKMKFQKRYFPLLLVLVLLCLVHVFILFMHIYLLRIFAGILLTFVLPGWAWLFGVNWLGTRDFLERLVLAAGVSSAFFAVSMLAAVYVPGPITLNLMFRTYAK